MEDTEKAVPTMAERVKELGITLTYRDADANPNTDEWAVGSYHYKVTLHCQGRQMTTFYSKGPGHNGEAPEAAEVLESLASDASGYEDAGSFESWCGNYDYDTDSRKAEKMYTVVKRNTAKLEQLLGSHDTVDAILYHTER